MSKSWAVKPNVFFYKVTIRLFDDDSIVEAEFQVDKFRVFCIKNIKSQKKQVHNFLIKFNENVKNTFLLRVQSLINSSVIITCF